MGRFDDGQPITPADEVRFYLDNANAADEEYEKKTAAEQEKLSKIADENMKSHSDALTVIIIAFVMLFFGTVFSALSDVQDFSEKEEMTAERLVSGRFFAEVEQNFNKSLPLKDYFHNACSAIRYCFGLGNTTDFIDIESKRLADDPYSITNTDQYISLESFDKSEDDGIDEDRNKRKTLPAIETTSNNKNRKIKGITLTTLKSEDEMLADDVSVSTVNRDAPRVTNNGFSPYKETETTTTTQQTESAEQTTSENNNYFWDPNKPTTKTTTTSATEQPPEETSGDPAETEPSETQPVETSSQTPPKTQNPYLVPAG